MLLKKVTVHENVKLDFFHFEEDSLTKDNIFINAKYKPTLNNYSRFLISFDDATLISKGITDTALGYTFSIYKEKDNNNKLIPVARLSEGGLSIKDYNVSNNSNYKYYIFKEDEEAISEAVISNPVDTCWWDWVIADIIPSEDDKGLYHVDLDSVWKFSLNISSAARTQNTNHTIYNNLTKYPKVSIGKLNYSTGSLTCLLGEVEKTSSGEISYVEPASLLDEWNDFCVNGNIKLLRDRKGNALLVIIDSTSAQLDDVSREQLNTLTFSWTQIGDASEVSVVG